MAWLSDDSVEQLNCDVKYMLVHGYGTVIQQTGHWYFVLYKSKRTAATILESNNHHTKIFLELKSKLDCVPNY